MPDVFDLSAFLALPRLHNLHLSPDGARLALTVQTVAPDGKTFQGTIWEVPTTGDGPARRISRPARDETARGFTPDGSLLFTTPGDGSAEPGQQPGAAAPAGRTDVTAATEPDALHILPAGSDVPRLVVAPRAGVGEVLTARSSPAVVVTAAMHPGATSLADDDAREQARKDAGVQARLVDHYPDRYWDHDIGPRQPRLLAIDLSGDRNDLEPRDLTPEPPWAGWLEDVHYSLNDDGSRVAFGAQPNTGSHYKTDLALAEVMPGGVVRILIDADVHHGPLAWSPDGTTIAVATVDVGTPDRPPRCHMHLVDAATGAVKELATGWEEMAIEVVWTRQGDALLVTADDRGHTPVFRIGLDGTVTTLTASGAYRNLALSPDGSALYAIRSHINEPPVPVVLDPRAVGQEPRLLSSPIPAVDTGTRLEVVTSHGADGEAVESWLVLPRALPATPLPLAVLIHGGPVSSWSGWHWRWSAPLLAARGWAVLLPNPRLSTGYGHGHIAAAWTDWATLPAADILAAIVSTVERGGVDAGRVAALGGSYGGYMANWLAVTSDRFAAIVTHASVWDLEMERDTSDAGLFMDREFGDPHRDENTWKHQSPHRRADALHTPMLVIHGTRDQRVPVGNSHSLWLALQQRSVPSRLLVYPDENHWILKPQNARLWYQTVFAFLDQHVLGLAWERPPLV